MLELFKVVVVTNLLASFVVYSLSKHVAFFASTATMDFLFYIVIIIWVIARLTWEGGSQSRNWAVDPAANKAKSMVSGHDFESDFNEQKKQNYQFGLMMFIAGLPAFLGAAFLLFLS
ncbi:MAG: hypothetical protein JKY55_13730 [Aliivibrio sp.]|uniref:hypothetical protein n=1 Tax=Aliivibrio sp. TaxID=1872443 RepID=UPI001A4EA507|nr:hypothetical protein [Aliivibrio sp.]